MKLLYVFDAYCGWSFGFAPTLTELVRRHPDLEVDVVSGGLLTGHRRAPIRDFGYIDDANAKISALTGVEFGAGYARLIADGSFVMDSEAAARGVVALREAAPDRIVELTAALQAAFFIDGMSLSDSTTYRRVAETAGLDAARVVDTFESPSSATAAASDFARVAELGIHSFPTLLAIDGERVALATGHATADQIEQRLRALTDAH